MQRNAKQARPIPLDYGRADPYGDVRREANAFADCFGGWLQFGTALTFCVVGLVLGSWTTDADVYLSVFLGLSGFVVGLFLPIPQARYGWHRLGISVLLGALGGIIGWWLFPAAWELLGLCGFRIGCAIYDWEL